MIRILVFIMVILTFTGISIQAVTVNTSSASFAMPAVQPPVFPDRMFNIKDFGAIPDGATLNTKAFSSSIEACSKAGGGHVVVPAGKWLTGPIHLKSNIDLHIEKGAEVLFSTDCKDYLPVVFTRWEGLECYNFSPLIYANGCKNVGVTGDGVLNGQGEPWWKWKRTQKSAAEKLYKLACDNVPVKDRVLGIEGGLRPSFIQPINCLNVFIQGVTLKSGPMWTIHPVYSENVIVKGVKVFTEGPNNDGVNPDSCRNVLIEDCFFSTGDDCIVLKSGLNEDSWRVNRPCENIEIRNCRTRRGHGGIVIGSEMSGGVRNVFAHDCTFDGTECGIRMKSLRGRGGVVENIRIQDISMREIANQAVIITTSYSASTLPAITKTPPSFHNIMIKNITCSRAKTAIELEGLPEMPIENITLENVRINAKNGLIQNDVKGLKQVDVRIQNDDLL